MNRLLAEIVAAKREDLAAILATRREPAQPLVRVPFRESLLRAVAPALICEIKKASPSQEVISADFDPAAIALSYKEGGAAALSVLTDVRFFQGAPEYLALAKVASGLPVLCKDFFVDPRQAQWAKALGADAILLIMRILSDSAAQEIYCACQEEGLDAVVETHDEEDIERAQLVGADMIGINNRDLDTFAVTLETAERLRACIPENALAIAESGIETNEDIRRLQRAGFDTFLVGGALMRAGDRARALKELRGQVC